MDKANIKSIINKNNPLIFEIGANDGTDTIDMCKVFDNKIKLYCYEPDPRAYQKLQYVLDPYMKEHLSCDIHHFEKAIGNTLGQIEFYQSDSNEKNSPIGIGDNWDKSGSIKKPTNHLNQHPWCKFGKSIHVNIARLSDEYEYMISQNNGFDEIIDFIWADVQGAELDLIAGGIDVLKFHTRYLYTEFSDIPMYDADSSRKTICDTLAVINYKLIGIYDNNLLFKNENL